MRLKVKGYKMNKRLASKFNKEVLVLGLYENKDIKYTKATLNKMDKDALIKLCEITSNLDLISIQDKITKNKEATMRTETTLKRLRKDELIEMMFENNNILASKDEVKKSMNKSQIMEYILNTNSTNSTESTNSTNSTNSTESTNSTNSTNSTESTESTESTNSNNALILSNTNDLHTNEDKREQNKKEKQRLTKENQELLIAIIKEIKIDRQGYLGVTNKEKMNNMLNNSSKYKNSTNKDTNKVLKLMIITPKFDNSLSIGAIERTLKHYKRNNLSISQICLKRVDLMKLLRELDSQVTETETIETEVIIDVPLISA